ncbi:hypothetical protein [Roseivivax marinus]|uniref:hypothetical protein n=1 Tax=Roseivivax marinus TaxID=1379903 RepID=UPI00273D8B81|nr:hypothetical protein [Roseivivax marinus]
MTHPAPISTDRIFIPIGTPSFEDLIVRMTAQGELFPSRRRDMISGLRRVAEALGLPTTDVPADPGWLRPRIAKVSPVLMGVSEKTWQNIRSNAQSAMAECGIVAKRQRSIRDLGPDWHTLWRRVLDLKDPTLPQTLCRFVHYLNRVGTGPADVTLAHAEAFRDAVALNEISKDPERTFRAAVEGWNLAIARVPGWPAHRIELPSRRKVIALPRERFPETFIADLDMLMNRLARPDPLSDQGRASALRPETIRQYRRQVMRFASELVAAGQRTTDLTVVTDLLQPATAERGLRQMLARNEGEPSRNIAETAALLRNLARILAVPPDDQNALRELARKLKMPRQVGMTKKNKARLRVLQEPAHKRRILTLPERVFDRAAGKSKPHTVALAREDALAVAILLHCPIRAKSLANLHLERHIQRPGDGRVFLVLEEADTKTKRSIEFQLHGDVVRLLDAHLATRVPYMCPAGTPYLFPQRSGERAIDPQALAGRISRRVWSETGLEMNAHLFRHFAVMNWLDAHPGEYEVAKRLLGHSALSHTINMYSGMEVTSAARAFSDLITGMKGKGESA